MDTPSTVCIKVTSLRKIYNDSNISLKQWMEDPNNLYVGRNGRIFITYPDIDPTTNKKRKEVFHYKGSKWQNPYKVGEKHYSLRESLNLYKKHLVNTGLVKDLHELKGKILGCFCDQKGECHAKLLVEMFKENINNK